MPGIQRKMVAPMKRATLKDRLLQKSAIAETDWNILEKKLGAELTPRIRLIADHLVRISILCESEQSDTLSIVKFKRRVRSFKKKAESLRDMIWPHPSKLNSQKWSIADAEKFFYMRSWKLSDGPTTPLAALKYSLDALVAICGAVEDEYEPDVHGVRDRDHIVRGGWLIRAVFKDHGLPHGIRKDTDKMKLRRSDVGSPFLDFYISLLQLRGYRWPLSSSALASAISRMPGLPPIK